MQIVINPDPSTWSTLQKRSEHNATSMMGYVEPILADIKDRGDAALREYTMRFDGYASEEIMVTQKEINEASPQLSDPLKQAIEVARQNIERFHRMQQEPAREIETMPGVLCRQKSVAIEKVGLYIPGGTAPLFSTVLMLAIPARIAGCKVIVLCTPPAKDGTIHPAILYAASITGVTAIYKVGGIQAIAAMAYGTATVPAVNKIFGPGNQYVTAAKQLVSLRDVAIDMPAGPSEVLVMADESADAAFIAADLLSQAEHGADSQVILLTNSKQLLNQVQAEVEKQLAALPRNTIASQALDNSRLILLPDLDAMIEFSNGYAPEHLILSVENCEVVAERITCAGSIFLGNYTPESAGDYASGTNHTLPTHGYARAYSGVNLDSFVKKITIQKIDPLALTNIGPVIETMAEAEQLQAHKNAVTIRLKKLQDNN
ncbi:MAG: histidinol dehydrogenase [Breznakibacter sp.]